MRFNIDKYKIMHLGKVIISINLKLELPILKQSYQQKAGIILYNKLLIKNAPLIRKIKLIILQRVYDI